jgi:hypothetical protein
LTKAITECDIAKLGEENEEEEEQSRKGSDIKK